MTLDADPRPTEHAPHGRARVLAQDYGVGIPPEDAERSFNDCRTEPARADADGQDVGLQVSRRLAEAANCRLWIERRGATTTFILELPLTARS